MKPPPFDYIRANTVQEAVEALAAGGGRTAPLAGGQSLLQMLARRQVQPDTVVDLNRLDELDYIVRRGDAVAIGALTRYRTVEQSAEVGAMLPLIPEALGYVGHATIRHRGTVGGSLAFGDPAGEFPCAAIILEATITLAGQHGVRSVPAADFFVGPYVTARGDDEIITEVSFPVSPPDTSWAVAEFSRRHRDYAVVATEVGLSIDADGTVGHARVGIAGGGHTVWRSHAAEQSLIGRPPTDAAFADAAAAAHDEAQPLPSVHADVDLRRNLVRVMTIRALQAARAKITGAAQ